MTLGGKSFCSSATILNQEALMPNLFSSKISVYKAGHSQRTARGKGLVSGPPTWSYLTFPGIIYSDPYHPIPNSLQLSVVINRQPEKLQLVISLVLTPSVAETQIDSSQGVWPRNKTIFLNSAKNHLHYICVFDFAFQFL